MITEERLKGIINQDGIQNIKIFLFSYLQFILEGVLYFLDSEDENTLWDNSIKDTCNRVR